jgi:hypothetical protein
VVKQLLRGGARVWGACNCEVGTSVRSVIVPAKLLSNRSGHSSAPPLLAVRACVRRAVWRACGQRLGREQLRPRVCVWCALACVPCATTARRGLSTAVRGLVSARCAAEPRCSSWLLGAACWRRRRAQRARSRAPRWRTPLEQERALALALRRRCRRCRAAAARRRTRAAHALPRRRRVSCLVACRSVRTPHRQALPLTHPSFARPRAGAPPPLRRCARLAARRVRAAGVLQPGAYHLAGWLRF